MDRLVGIVAVLSFALMIAIRARVVAAALSVAFGSVGAAQSPSVSPPSKRMRDGKQWTTENLNATSEQSYCYDNSEQNCRRYGRLYTWDSAQQACRAFYNFGKGAQSLGRHEDGEKLRAFSVRCVKE